MTIIKALQVLYDRTEDLIRYRHNFILEQKQLLLLKAHPLCLQTNSNLPLQTPYQTITSHPKISALTSILSLPFAFSPLLGSTNAVCGTLPPSHYHSTAGATVPHSPSHSNNTTSAPHSPSPPPSRPSDPDSGVESPQDPHL